MPLVVPDASGASQSGGTGPPSMGAASGPPSMTVPSSLTGPASVTAPPSLFFAFPHNEGEAAPLNPADLVAALNLHSGRIAFWRVPFVFPGIIRLVVVVGVCAAVPQLFALVTKTLRPKVWGDDSGTIGGTCDIIRYLIAFLCAGIVGKLSDTLGRKPMLIFLLIAIVLPGIALLLLGFGTAGMWAYEVLATLLFGVTAMLTSGLNPAISAAIVDQVPPDNITAAFGWVYAVAPLVSSVIGVTVGVVFEQWIGDKGEWGRILVIIYSVFLAGAAMTLTAGLPEDPEEERTFSEIMKGAFSNPFAPLVAAYRNRRLWLLCWIVALVTLGESLPKSQSMFDYLVNAYKIKSDQDAQRQVSAVLALGFGCTFVPIALLLPVLQNLMRRESMLVLMLILAVYATVSPILALLQLDRDSASGAIGASGGFMLLPFIVLDSLVPRMATAPEEIGAYFGAVTATKFLFSIIGSLLQTLVYNSLHTVGVPWLAFVLFGAICALSIPVALMLRHRSQEVSYVSNAFALRKHLPPKAFRWWVEQSMRTFAHLLTHVPFGIVSFCIVAIMFGLGMGTLVLWVGFLVFVVLFKILVRFGFWDLILASWVLREIPPRVLAVTPTSPWTGGIFIFLQEIGNSGILVLFFHFFIVHLPASIGFGAIAFACYAIPIFFISSPVLFAAGVPGLCLQTEPLGTNSSFAVPSGLAINQCVDDPRCTMPCSGAQLDSLVKSFYPMIIGLIILPFLLPLSTWLSLSLARVTKWVLGARTMAAVNPASRTGSWRMGQTGSTPVSFRRADSWRGGDRTPPGGGSRTQSWRPGGEVTPPGTSSWRRGGEVTPPGTSSWRREGEVTPPARTRSPVARPRAAPPQGGQTHLTVPLSTDPAPVSWTSMPGGTRRVPSDPKMGPASFESQKSEPS